jgi:hypothetical protein
MSFAKNNYLHFLTMNGSVEDSDHNFAKHLLFKTLIHHTSIALQLAFCFHVMRMDEGFEKPVYWEVMIIAFNTYTDRYKMKVTVS